jgi:hypothetical protein
MAELIVSHQISFDTAQVRSSNAPLTVSFFEASPYPYIDGSIRVTDFDEKSIVRWLMLYLQSRRIIFEGLGLSHMASYAPELVQTFSLRVKVTSTSFFVRDYRLTRLLLSNASALRSKQSKRARTKSTSYTRSSRVCARPTSSTVVGAFSRHTSL